MSEKSKNIEVIKSPISFKKPVLAFGAQLKNTFCFAKQKHLYISKVNGNLEEYDNYVNYEKGIKSLLSKLRIKPKIIAYDLHPDYSSNKLALEYAKKNKIDNTIAIQHHHAHIAATAAFNNVNGKVIGVALDGTGYGTDGNIWGGEFIIADLVNFKRAAHLKYIPMPGGQQAIIEPWRMTISWLCSIFKNRASKLNLDFVKRVDKTKFDVIQQMLDKNINSPLTSSMGRLFDAVSGIITKRKKIEFEAQGPVELEEMAFAAIDSRFSSYSFSIKEDGCLIIDPSRMFRQIISDINKKGSLDKIAFKFHCTVVKIIKDTCLILRKKYHLNNVVLSGGVFQNRIVSELTQDMLRKENFTVFIHNEIPINDAGISVGQAIVANAKISKRSR